MPAATPFDRAAVAAALRPLLPRGAVIANQAELDARLRSLEDDAEDDLDGLEAFPIISLGINYAF